MSGGVTRIRIPGNARKDICDGCGETIYFVQTERGKWSPTNPDGTSHFATCPHASDFRKPSGRPPDPDLEEHAEEYEERIGILYYDAGLPLPLAESIAAKQLREKYPAYHQAELL